MAKRKLADVKAKSPAGKPLAICCSDLHLDRCNWKNRPKLAGDSRWAFEYLCTQAIEREVLFVLAAGDLLDVPEPDSETVEQVRKQLDRLQEANIEFLYIQGQHEFADPPWFQAVHSWPTHLHGQAVSLRSGFDLYGLDFQRAATLEAELAKIPATADMLMCHQVWLEFMGGVAVCEGSLARIPHVKTVLTGDYHRHELKTVVAADGRKVRVFSPGSTSLREINEEPNKNFWLLDEAGGMTSERIPTRIVLRTPFTLADEASLETFLAEVDAHIAEARADAVKLGLPEELQTPILRAAHQETLSDAARRIIRAVGDTAHLFLTSVPVETPERVELRERREEVRSQGMLGCLAQRAKPKSRLYKDAARLLQAADAELELAEMRKETELELEVKDAES